MINCNIGALGALCSQLMLYRLTFDDDHGSETDLRLPLGEEIKGQVVGWLEITDSIATDFEWKAVHDRIEIINKKLKKSFSRRDFGVEARILLETINAELKWQLIYRYPQDRSAVLQDWQRDWADALKAFPSTRQDVLAVVDLWALGHPTASVFQFMRVLESGLRVLAADVGRNFDRQQWHNIIEEIESEITKLRKSAKTPERDERLQWLSEMAKEFFYFKDGWRNHVSHGRGKYDEHQARIVMEHVRAFMSALSSKLAEQEN